jgi:HD-GYP domain-containing protein (c-di-GMP phosphodiesterase class II)
MVGLRNYFASTEAEPSTPRILRQALSNEEAWRQLLEGSGTQFCPETIRVLGDVLGVAPAGQEAQVLPLRATG